MHNSRNDKPTLPPVVVALMFPIDNLCEAKPETFGDHFEAVLAFHALIKEIYDLGPPGAGAAAAPWLVLAA